jgi:hypothetical protein
MMEDRDNITKQFRDMLESLTPEQLADLGSDFERETQLAVLKARRETTPKHELGTPKDPAVQRAAAEWFRLMRKPEYRQRWVKALGDEQLSYEDLGERYLKVSRERVRQIYAELCPFDYESERQSRRSGVGAVREVG